MEFVGVCSPGKRKENQDVVAINESIGLFCVCDGMGGLCDGDIAAHQASSIFSQTIQERFKSARGLSSLEILSLMMIAVKAANKNVFFSAKSKNIRMGTTLTAGILHDNMLYFCHIGDTRIYHYNNMLTCLTRDHAGPARNTITRAIGIQYSVEADIGMIDVMPADIFLISSDGVHDYISESSMGNILSIQSNLSKKAEAIEVAALSGGSRDNISLILIKA